MNSQTPEITAAIEHAVKNAGVNWLACNEKGDQPSKEALAWLLASDETPETKVREATKALRKYGFDESKPLTLPVSQWRVNADAFAIAVSEINERGAIVSHICVLHRSEDEQLRPTDEIMRQAQLIAAAPELLEACKAALADLEGIMPEFEPSGDRKHPAWETIKAIRAAIAKAGGAK